MWCPSKIRAGIMRAELSSRFTVNPPWTTQIPFTRACKTPLSDTSRASMPHFLPFFFSFFFFSSSSSGVFPSKIKVRAVGGRGRVVRGAHVAAPSGRGRPSPQRLCAAGGGGPTFGPQPPPSSAALQGPRRTRRVDGTARPVRTSFRSGVSCFPRVPTIHSFLLLCFLATSARPRP